MAFLSYSLLKSAHARKIARACLKRRATVLMYHGVTPTPLPVYNWCHIPVHEFRLQAEWIKNTYRVLPLEELATCLREGRALPERAACITFDDGFRNVAEHAAPVLESLGLPFTVFIVGSLLESGAPPWPETLFAALLDSTKSTIDWNNKRWDIQHPTKKRAFYENTIATLIRMSTDMRAKELSHVLGVLDPSPSTWPSAFSTLQQEELKQLTASGLCHLGAHSQTHEILTGCSTARLREELGQCRETLFNMPGYVDLFAYPNGDLNPSVIAATREAGYQAAVTVEHRLCHSGDNPFTIPRVGIRAGLSMPLFESKVLGC